MSVTTDGITRPSPIQIPVQEGLERLDGGGSAFIYAVNDRIVLKAPVIFTMSKENPSRMDNYEYALETVCYHDDIENERAILRRLAQVPHANVVQVVALENPEGVYLRRYSPLSKKLTSQRPAQSIRFEWYRDMLRALVHLHGLKIAHADVRIDNFLCDSNTAVVLCDFSCSRPFGGDNPSATRSFERLGVNGFSQIVSDATDRFALASVIFEIETSTKPNLDIINDTLQLPVVNTDSNSLDLIIQKAWLDEYDSTESMLSDVEALSMTSSSLSENLRSTLALGDLRNEVDHWRRVRIARYGTKSIETATIAQCTDGSA